MDQPGFSAYSETAAAADGSGWVQMWDETSSRIYYANRTLNVSQWERPPGATFASPPTAETPQQPGTAAAALGGGAIPVPADIKL